MECQCTIAIAKNSFFVYHCSRTRKGGIAVPIITLPENNKKLSAAAGTTLLDALKENGLYPDAPCGGNGTCGKCTLLVNGTQVLACRTVVDRDMTVVLPQAENRILQERFCATQSIDPLRDGYLLAFDIGTTSVVCSLLDGKTGAELLEDINEENFQSLEAEYDLYKELPPENQQEYISRAVTGVMEHLYELDDYIEKYNLK